MDSRTWIGVRLFPSALVCGGVRSSTVPRVCPDWKTSGATGRAVERQIEPSHGGWLGPDNTATIPSAMGARADGQARPPVRSRQKNRELLAQSQVLEGQLASGSESGYGGSEQHSKKANHDVERISATGANAAIYRTDEKTTGTPLRPLAGRR